MATSQPGGRPQISPDGRWWWDGREWQPLFSPDGTHRWNGRAWVPVATAAPPAAATRPDGSPTWLPEESVAALQGPPEIVASPGAPAEPLPEWAMPAGPRGRPWIIWGSVAVIVGVLGLLGWNLKDQLPALNLGFHNAPAAVSGRATPDPTLTQYQRADRLLNVQLAPMLIGAGQAEQSLATDCAQAHQQDQPCRVAMADVYHKLDLVIQQIDRSDIPPCIQQPMQDYRNTLNRGANELSAAVQAFDAKSVDQESSHLQSFAAIIAGSTTTGQSLQTSFQACPNS